MTAEEKEYLALVKAGLDVALNGALIAGGIAALPLGFLFSLLGSRRGFGGDQLATLLAVGILAALTWGVLAYSGKGARTRTLRPGDVRLRSQVASDLEARAVDTTAGLIEAREDVRVKPWWQRQAPKGAPRRFFLTVAGRRYEVSASRWLASAVGEPIALEHAAYSRIVLTIDGVRDRLPLGDLPRGDDEDALGIPVKPG